MKLSIVIPIFNEAEVIEELHSRLDKLMSQFESHSIIESNDIEIVFVNDGSTDRSFELLMKIVSQSVNYKLVNFSRNFGHQAAVTAGISKTTGDAVALIDADLQDPPEFIFDLYQKMQEGFDVVYAVRKKREGESFLKLLTANVFYKLQKKLTNVDIPVNTGDFRIMSRRVADIFLTMQEKNKYIRGLISWIGFNQAGLEYNRNERYAGTTKYPITKMVNFAIDGISSFSAIPLRLSSYVGFLSALAGFIFGVYVLYLKLFTSNTELGWSSIIILILFFGGLQLICIGILGEYIARLSDEAKRRPYYIIDNVYEKE